MRHLNCIVRDGGSNNVRIHSRLLCQEIPHESSVLYILLLYCHNEYETRSDAFWIAVSV